MAKRGRPPSENPLNKRVTIRMTAEMYDRLLAYAKAANKTKTDVILESMKKILYDQN